MLSVIPVQQDTLPQHVQLVLLATTWMHQDTVLSAQQSALSACSVHPRLSAMSVPQDMEETTAPVAQQDFISQARYAEVVPVLIYSALNAHPHQPVMSVQQGMLYPLASLVQQVSMRHQLIHLFAVPVRLM